MIFDAVEAVYTVLNGNVATIFAALATAKSITNLSTPPTMVKRQDAELAIQNGLATPFIGIYAKAAKTQAKNQSRRPNVITVVADAYMRGSDPVLLAQQMDLMPEAILGCIDLLPGTSGGIYGGGEVPGSVDVQITMGYQLSAGGVQYDRRAVVTFPVHQLDQGV